MFWIIIAFCVALDQISKYLISSTMTLGETAPLLGDVMRLHYILNDGATMSMLSGKRWFFVGLTIVVLIVMIYLHYKVPRDYKSFHITLAFFIGGTLGNFIETYVLSIFNVADCFITISVIVLCCMLIFGRLGRLLDKKEKISENELKKND